MYSDGFWNPRPVRWVYNLEGLAAVEARWGRGHQAQVYAGAAERLREEAGSAITPIDQAALNRWLAPALARPSPAQERAAREAGQRLPLAEIVADALESRPPAPAAVEMTA